jgi:hypothetical protein
VFDTHMKFTGRRSTLMIARLAMAAILSTLLVPLLPAAQLDVYRGFQFGMSLSEAAEQAGIKATDAISVHQRPALIQLLDFEPRLVHSSEAKDPVSQISLTFYNGELARIAVLYDRYKVDGMTPEDMIAALSAAFGTASRPVAEIAYHSYYAEVAPVLARWEDAQYSFNLIRVDDRSSFALILFSKRLDALAQQASVESARLDAVDAPAKEAERARKQAEDVRAEQEKSRLENKANFRP